MTLPWLHELSVKTRQAVADVDPTAYLLADHDWLRSVLEAYRPVVGNSVERKRIHGDVLELQTALDLHIRREEDAYFPAIENVMEELGQGSTFDMYGEHDAIRIRLDELLQALSEGIGAPGAFAAFVRSLVIHFENEEELLFADAPSHLSMERRHQVLDLILKMT
jgi:iron-sulfur cluster repair protein YtfE (RIC family)